MAGRMVGRTYRLPERVFGGQGRASGLVRVLVQGRGWPTNVLVERVDGPLPMIGERFVRPARGLRKIT
jgi:hypothetical protein